MTCSTHLLNVSLVQCFLLQIKKYPLGQKACSRMSPDRCADRRDIKPFAQAVQGAVEKLPQFLASLYIIPSTGKSQKCSINTEKIMKISSFGPGYIFYQEMTMCWGVPNISFHHFCFTEKFKTCNHSQTEKKGCFKISAIFVKIKFMPVLSGTSFV